MPALEKTGTYILELTVKQINGSSNEENTSISTDVNAFTVLPVKRPLMEEYTSASCGYCPKGMAALDIMKEQKGEDFIAVSFHTWGDPLDFYTEMPAGSGASLSLPIAQIDRSATIDPYLGNNKDSFGLDKCWEKAAEKFSTAAIALEGSFDGTDAVLNSDVTFVHSVDADAYRVEFFVVADDLVVPGGNQKNYYSKNESCRGMEGLDKFVDSPNVIKDYAYDDTVVAWSGKNGGVDLPSAQEYETLQASETLTVPTVARSSMLRGVAAIVDNATGEVINAIQCPLNSSGIISTTEERMSVETSYWTLQGIPVTNPDGICIRRVIYSDGYCETSKTVVVKN